MKHIKYLILALALLIGIAGIASATKTKLTPSELLSTLSARTWNMPLTGGALQPAKGVVLGATIADRSLRLKGLSCIVRTIGTGGSSKIFISKNGTAVASSTVDVARTSYGVDSALTSAALDVAVSPGDAIAIIMSTVTTGATSGPVRCRADMVEDFSP